MALNLTQTLISAHLASGNMKPGKEIAWGAVGMVLLEEGPAERIQANPAVVPGNHGLVKMFHVDERVSPRLDINQSRGLQLYSRPISTD